MTFLKDSVDFPSLPFYPWAWIGIIQETFDVRHVVVKDEIEAVELDQKASLVRVVF